MNALIFIFTISASVILFTGFKFMHGYEVVLDSTKLGSFKFFTVDSNIFMGIVSFIFLIKEIELLLGRINYISNRYYILKLMATSQVSLTIFVVLFYLGPSSSHGVMPFLMNNNLFFHFIIPVLSIITFTCFERTDCLKSKNIFISIIPTIVYSLCYLINVLLHIKDGVVSRSYDWYCFLQTGVWKAIVIMPIVLVITYIICLIIYILNKSN